MTALHRKLVPADGEAFDAYVLKVLGEHFEQFTSEQAVAKTILRNGMAMLLLDDNIPCDAEVRAWARTRCKTYLALLASRGASPGVPHE